MTTTQLRIGTCSWKFPSWHGLVYPAAKGINYLESYAQRYNTVEIDRWFWSLFGEESSAFCPQCGRSVAADDQFCRRCGAPLDE